MSRECRLADLLKTPKQPLTKDQWNNFGELYMGMVNDNIPTNIVSIKGAVSRRIAEIKVKGTYLR